MEKTVKGNAKLGNLYEDNEITEVTIKTKNGQEVSLKVNNDRDGLDTSCEGIDFEGFNVSASVHLVTESEKGTAILGFKIMTPLARTAVVDHLLPSPEQMFKEMIMGLGGCNCRPSCGCDDIEGSYGDPTPEEAQTPDPEAN